LCPLLQAGAKALPAPDASSSAITIWPSTVKVGKEVLAPLAAVVVGFVVGMVAL
jgi:hypothetical protein